MVHPYQIYTNEQLQEEKERLHEKLNIAKEEEKKAQVAINQRKIEIVRSYMKDLSQFHPGDIFELKSATKPTLFKIDEMSGVNAWGNRLDRNTYQVIGELESLLVDYLGEKIK